MDRVANEMTSLADQSEMAVRGSRRSALEMNLLVGAAKESVARMTYFVRSLVQVARSRRASVQESAFVIG
jgi:hypothetical protein